MSFEGEVRSDRSLLRVSRRLCPHCDKRVSFKTFKAHKRLYYDPARDHWFTSVSVPESQCDEEPTTDEAPPSSFRHNSASFSASTDAAPSFSYYDEGDGKSSPL